ncbi:MAG: DNA internalization-related competence protein ComEC/Rec2 [Acidobacteriota bacterium]
MLHSGTVKQPLLLPAIALLTGTWVIPEAAPMWLLALAAAAVLGVGILCYRRDRVALAAMLASAALIPAGGLNRLEQDAAYSAHLLSPGLLGATRTEYVDMTGTVLRLPRPLPDRYQLDVAVDSMEIGRDTRIGLQFNLRLSIPHSQTGEALPLLLPGDRVEFAARVFETGGFRNPGAFDQAAYLKSESIHHRGYTKSPALVRKVADGGWSLRRLAAQIRQDFAGRLAGINTRGVAAGDLAAALILGERERLPQDVQESMRRSGLYHLLAISGGNFAVFALFLFMFLRVLRLPERIVIVLVFVAMLLYAAMVEFEPSVVRSFLMITVYLAGRLLYRDHQLMNTLAIALLLTVAASPSAVYDYGFQLTFLATAVLVVFVPRITAIARTEGRAGWFRSLTSVNLSTTLGLAPYLAYHFNRVTLCGLALNYAAIPLSGLILGLGLVFYLASYVSVHLSLWTGKLISLAAQLFLALSNAVPFPSIVSYRVPSSPAFVIWAFYALLIASLVPFRRRIARYALFSAIALTFVLSVSWPFTFPPRGLRFTFIDVGQGDSTLVEFPTGERMLVDGGGNYDDSFDFGASVVAPYLFHRGFARIDYVVVSHAHADHINGLRYIVSNFRVDQVWEGINPLDDPFYARFRRAVPAPTAVRQLARGDRISIGSVLIEVLGPAGRERHAKVRNDDSLVLRLTFGESSALLPGDIETRGIQDIMESGLSMRSTLLKCPHHGSKSNLTAGFQAAVRPQVVVISAGQGNPWNLPNPAVVAAFRGDRATVLRTDLSGAVSIELDGQGSWRRLSP